MGFGLPDRLLDMRPHPLDEARLLFRRYRIIRPDPEQGLVDEILGVPIGQQPGRPRDPVLARNPGEPLQIAAPFVRDLRKDIEPLADVLAALGVVGRGGDQRERPITAAVEILPVELGRRTAEMVRIAPDLVERDEAVADIKGCVFHPLGHDRACDLLEPQDEILVERPRVGIQILVKAEQQDIPDEIKEGRIEIQGCDCAPFRWRYGYTWHHAR